MTKRKSNGKEKEVIKKSKIELSTFELKIYPTLKLKVGFEISYARGCAFVSKIHNYSRVKREGKLKVGDIITKINNIELFDLDIMTFNTIVIYLENICDKAKLFKKKDIEPVYFLFNRNQYSLLPHIDVEHMIYNIHSTIKPLSRNDYIKKMEDELSKAENYAKEYNSEMLNISLKEARKYASLADLNIENRISKIPKISIENNHSYYVKMMNYYLEEAEKKSLQLDMINMDYNLIEARRYALLANDLKWGKN